MQSTKEIPEILKRNGGFNPKLVENWIIAARTVIARHLGIDMARVALSRVLSRSLANDALSSHHTNIPSSMNESHPSDIALAPKQQTHQLESPQSNSLLVQSSQKPPSNLQSLIPSMLSNQGMQRSPLSRSSTTIDLQTSLSQDTPSNLGNANITQLTNNQQHNKTLR